MRKYVIDVEYKKAIPIDKFVEYVEKGFNEGIYKRLLEDYLLERNISAYDVFSWDDEDKKSFLSEFADSLTYYEDDLFFVVEIDE
jgi:hypothetical protein